MHRTEERQQLDRVNKYKKVLEHRQQESSKKLEATRQEYEERESRLQNRIEQL